MASIYSRRNQIWIKFTLPGSGRVERLSLQTSDWGRAALIQRKVELQVELMDPAVVGLEIPEKIRQMLPTAPGAAPALAAEPPKPVPVEAETTVSSLAKLEHIEHVLSEFRRGSTHCEVGCQRKGKLMEKSFALHSGSIQRLEKDPQPY